MRARARSRRRWHDRHAGRIDVATPARQDPAPGDRSRWTCGVDGSRRRTCGATGPRRCRPLSEIRPTPTEAAASRDHLRGPASGAHRARDAGIEPWTHETPAVRRRVTLRDPTGEVVDVRSLGRLPAGRGARPPAADQRRRRGDHRGEPPRDPPRPRAGDHRRRLRRDLELMKRHHVNAVRTSHYPHDERSTTCATNSACTSSTRQRRDPRPVARSATTPVLGAIVDRGVRMVQRDRNHPCVSPGRWATSGRRRRPTTPWRPPSGASIRPGRSTTRAGSCTTSTPPAR